MFCDILKALRKQRKIKQSEMAAALNVTQGAVANWEKGLRAQRRKQAAQRLKSGIWIDNEITTDLVFRQTNGKAHTRGTISRTLSKVGSAIGKPDLHPHDLRHSYAIAALRSGASVKTVQHNLGHKSSEMTLDVYAAYTEDAGKTDAVKLSNYLTEIPPINI